MPIVNGMNSDYINYFPLFDYVNKIKLSPAVLEHLEATNREFDNYMHTLSCYDEEYIVNYFIYSLYSELMSSTRIENVNFDVKELTNKDLFFDTLTISNRRIHLLHNFITEGEMEPSFEYRKKEVNVSKINNDGTEDINAWFNFILDMADEQLFVAIGRIPSIDNRFIVNDNDIKKIRSMRLSKIK